MELFYQEAKTETLEEPIPPASNPKKRLQDSEPEPTPPSKVQKANETKSFNPIRNPGTFVLLPKDIFEQILTKYLLLPTELLTVAALSRTCTAILSYVWKVEFWKKKEVYALKIATLIKGPILLNDLRRVWPGNFPTWNVNSLGDMSEFICKHFEVRNMEHDIQVYPTPIDQLLATFKENTTKQVSTDKKDKSPDRTLINKVKSIFCQISGYENGIATVKLARHLYNLDKRTWTEITGMKLERWLQINSSDFAFGEGGKVFILGSSDELEPTQQDDEASQIIRKVKNIIRAQQDYKYGIPVELLSNILKPHFENKAWKDITGLKITQWLQKNSGHFSFGKSSEVYIVNASPITEETCTFETAKLGCRLTFGESELIEFKAIQFSKGYEAMLKNAAKSTGNGLVSFVNQGKGTLYLGVRNDCLVLGVYLQGANRDEFSAKYQQRLNNEIFPRLNAESIQISFAPVQGKIDHYLIRLEIYRGSQPLYFNKHGDALERVGASCSKMTRTQIFERLEKHEALWQKWLEFDDQLQGNDPKRHPKLKKQFCDYLNGQTASK